MNLKTNTISPLVRPNYSKYFFWMVAENLAKHCAQHAEFEEKKEGLIITISFEEVFNLIEIPPPFKPKWIAVTCVLFLLSLKGVFTKNRFLWGKSVAFKTRYIDIFWILELSRDFFHENQKTCVSLISITTVQQSITIQLVWKSRKIRQKKEWNFFINVKKYTTFSLITIARAFNWINKKRKCR